MGKIKQCSMTVFQFKGLFIYVGICLNVLRNTFIRARMDFFKPVLSIAALLLAISAQADEVNVAVAANFIEPMNLIAAEFAKDTGHQAKLSLGSSSSLYVQIINGAPFDVFLSADDEKPVLLEKMDLGVAGSRYIYATGSLVLWSAKEGFVDDKGEVLRRGKFNRIAIANPKLAPYGKAAVDTLTSMGLLDDVSAKFALGENITQAYQFAKTGNADLGFVALSQVMKDGKISGGSAWIVPDNRHMAIRQEAIFLSHGKDKTAAKALMAYLKGDKAKAIIRSYGYKD
jgi:molybdate transport system substrate-binding protein